MYSLSVGDEPSSDWCQELEASQLSTGGAESRFIETNDSSAAAWVVYFWKIKGSGFNYTEDAESTLEDAAVECVMDRGINPANLYKLSRCIGQHAISPSDSKLAAVVALNAETAETLAMDGSEEIPLIQKKTTLVYQNKPTDVTFIALPQ